MSDHEDPKPDPLLNPPTLDDPESAAQMPRAADGGPAVDPNAPRRRAASPASSGSPGSPASAPAKRSTARRISFWLGIGLILAGISLLAYVAWQLWGTNWVSHRKQKEEVTKLQEDWAAKDCAAPEKGKASAIVKIPDFGSSYRIPVLEGDDDGGISQEVLAKGIGHFANTAPAGSVQLDGKPGNYALAGHRVTHGEPLRDLPKLRPGALVTVETCEQIFTYKLDTNPNDLVIDFKQTWVLGQFPKNPNGGVSAVTGRDAPDPICLDAKAKRDGRGTKIDCDIKDMYKHVLTLTTCSELFHTDNRMIAFGHLVMVEQRLVAK